MVPSFLLQNFEMFPGKFLPQKTQSGGLLRRIWVNQSGQDVAEYAVILAVILLVAIGMISIIGAHARELLSQVGSVLQSHSSD